MLMKIGDQLSRRATDPSGMGNQLGRYRAS